MYKQPKPKLSPYKRIPCYGMFDTDDSGSKWQYLSDECYLYREVVIEGKPHFECETGEVLTRRQVSITKRRGF